MYLKHRVSEFLFQVVSGFSDHGPISITCVQRFDCRASVWHTHNVGIPLGQDVDYSDGLYGHTLVAHGKYLVLFGGLLSGESHSQRVRFVILCLIHDHRGVSGRM